MSEPTKLIQGCCETVLSETVTPDGNGNVLVDPAAWAAACEVARYVREAVREDDGEPVTEEWLRSGCGVLAVVNSGKTAS